MENIVVDQIASPDIPIVEDSAPDASAEKFEANGDTVDQKLQNWFAAADEGKNSQVDNSDDVAENADKDVTTDDTQTSDETEIKEVAKTENSEKSAETADPVETANFEALEDKPPVVVEKYETEVEKIREQFPRQSKELTAYAAKLATEANLGNEAIQKLGGQELIEPMAVIANGIKSGDPQTFFKGIIQASDQNTLLDFIGNALNLGIVKSQDFINDPETQDFGERLQGITDIIIQNRFGENLGLAQIESLADFQKYGWLDALSRWKDAGYVDPDEFDELLQSDKEPAKFLNLQKQIAEERQQREQLEAKLKETETTKVQQVELDFDKANTSALDKVLTDVVWQGSTTLKDAKGDSAEVLEEKKILREILRSDALAALHQSSARDDLLKAFKKGEMKTKDYEKKYSAFINSAILQTKEKTGVFERLLFKIYKKSPDAKITDPVNNNADQLPPTETTRFSPKETKSIRDIDRNLENAFASLGK